MTPFLYVIACLVLLLVLYLLWIRPWQLRWGATDEEVAHPHFNATRAITIHARPEQIWPWLVQIGFGRAGWYSYDWIDNLGRPSADRIVPELQNLKVGDHIALSKWTYETVAAIDPYRSMLWGGDGSSATDGTWAWGLYPLDEHSTRLVVRMRGRYAWLSPTIFLLLLVDVFDIVMMRKMLLNLKARAEKLTLLPA